jgi:hypothetical protein
MHHLKILPSHCRLVYSDFCGKYFAVHLHLFAVYQFRWASQIVIYRGHFYDFMARVKIEAVWVNGS